MAQGFVKSNNFIESDTGSLDRNILDNLGGANITDDLLLFDGNFKFTSKLVRSDTVTDYVVENGRVRVTGEGKVPFSTGTVLSHEGGEYNLKVVKSNALDSFEIVTAQGAAFIPTGTLRRSDAVLASNLANLSVKRLQTNTSNSSGISVEFANASADLLDDQTINQQVSYINEKVGLFYYKSGRVPLTYKATTFNVPITFKGPVRIVADQSTPSTVPSSSTPGLFIVNVGDASAPPARAFSDASNPWVKSGVANASTSALATTVQYSQVSTLKLSASAYNTPSSITVNPNFNSTNNNHTVSETNAVGSFTHKLPVMVNGQQYYLLLKT
jgi:hypothetical protein